MRLEWVEDAVPAGQRDVVFERFARLEDAGTHTAGSVDGTGLGLAIARDLVARHGGSLTIADTDTGTKFVAALQSAGRSTGAAALHPRF